jgi:hypothetical protein
MGSVITLNRQHPDPGVLLTVKALRLLLTSCLFLGSEPLYEAAIPVAAKRKKIVAKLWAVRVKKRILERLRSCVCSCQIGCPTFSPGIR